MRILFLLTQDLQSPSGLGRYYPLARELALLGHAVTVYALHPDFRNLEKISWSEGNLRIQYVAPMHVQKKGNLKTYYGPLKLLSIVLQATWALTWAALKEQPDLIWIGKPHPMNGVAGIIAKYIRRSRLFLDCDDDEAGSGNFQASWQRSVMGWFEAYLPRFADQVTANTFFTLDRLLRHGIAKVKTYYLPNGVDQTRFQEEKNIGDASQLREQSGLAGKKVVSYIGSMSLANHGVDLLVAAFQKVHQSLPDARLLLIGSGEDYQKLQEMVQQRNLAPLVHFVGRIPPDDIPPYYRLSDVTVDPIYNNVAAVGRSPLKLFEAWACGVPVVTSPIGDRQYLAGDPPAAYFTGAGDVDDLSKGILSVLSDAALRDALVQRGKQRLPEFTWQYLAECVQRDLLADPLSSPSKQGSA